MLRRIDIFGINFPFYINNDIKYYSKIGGIFTIISFCIGCLLFYALSGDFFKRENPTTSKINAQTTEYKAIKFGQEKIWIPWRISDYEGNELNFTDKVYPIPYYFYGKRNKKDGTMPVNSQILTWRRCNETDLPNMDYQLENIKLDYLLCFNMEDIYMGGSYFEDFVYHIQFDIFLCKDGINYQQNNQKCTSYEQLQNYIGTNNAWHVELYFPEVQYQPTNLNKPMLIKYKKYFYNFSGNSRKIDRIYLQEHVLNDDQGWISSSEKNYTYWGYESLTGDSYFFNLGKNELSDGSTSRIYSINIYLNPGIVYYKRSYIKLFKMLSEVLPIVKLIFEIFAYFTFVFKKTQLENKFMAMFFEFNKNELTIQREINEINNPQTKEEPIKDLDKSRDNLIRINEIHTGNKKSVNHSAPNLSLYFGLDQRKSNSNFQIKNAIENRIMKNNQRKILQMIKDSSKSDSKNDNKSKGKQDNAGGECKQEDEKDKGKSEDDEGGGSRNEEENIMNIKKINVKKLGSIEHNDEDNKNILTIPNIKENKSKNSNNSNKKSDNLDKISNSQDQLSMHSIHLPAHYLYQKNTIKPLPEKFTCYFLLNYISATLFRNCISKTFVVATKFMHEIYDISSYLSLYKQFIIMKKFITNEKIISLIESEPQINVNSLQFFNLTNSQQKGFPKYSYTNLLQDHIVNLANE